MSLFSLLFLFLFLPVTLFFAYISSERLRNIFLLASSWIFYAWGGVSYLSILIGVTLVNYLAGILIDKAKSPKGKKVWLVAGILLNILPLVIFKYTGFFSENINVLITLFHGSPMVVSSIILPLGISFYTFRAITYLVSVKRGEAPAQRNYVNLALFISFFPSVLAGPIDRYKNFLPQLQERKFSFENFSSGVKRFVLGLGKKVLIANSLAFIADSLFNAPLKDIDTPLAWLAVVCYALQIYYDFSGYTDMAIGVGRMLGFELMENFNFPYISTSIKEFWQRWHISLSTWLRDYIFLPLAYSTSRKLKKYRYLGIRTDEIIYIAATSVTFLVCGFWHGAAWNFVIWGLLHGLMLILEQAGLGRFLRKIYKPFSHLYALFILLLTWVFFRTPTPDAAFHFIGLMFGQGGKPAEAARLLDYLSTGAILTLVISMLGATPFFRFFLERLKKPAEHSESPLQHIRSHAYGILSLLFVVAVFVMSTFYILAGTNISFIYFRF